MAGSKEEDECFMKVIVIATLFGISLLKCGGPDGEGSRVPESCNIRAKVVDLSGLDGCGFVLQLEDGTRLIPEKRTYIQAPKIEDDPLYYFDLVPGQDVRVGYRETNLANVCMVGPTVFVTCITKLE